MSFKTYQAEAFQKYLAEHQKQLANIYKMIGETDYTYTALAKRLNYNYYQFRRRFIDRKFTIGELMILLDAIK